MEQKAYILLILILCKWGLWSRLNEIIVSSHESIAINPFQHFHPFLLQSRFLVTDKSAYVELLLC